MTACPELEAYLGDDERVFIVSAEITLYRGGSVVEQLYVRDELTGQDVDVESRLGDWAGEHGQTREQARNHFESELLEIAIDEEIARQELEEESRGRRGWL